MDGLWLDMNEISNFCNGECYGDSHPEESRRSVDVLKFDPFNPPYRINNQGNRIGLNIRTVDPDAVHYGGVLEYNCHNLYGEFNHNSCNVCTNEVSSIKDWV